jgi:ATP-binding cassette subfamily F protein 3
VVFSGVDLRVGRGERIGIVGRNGTGKSTLLRILAGRAKPSAGELMLGHKAECGFYDQDTSELREDGTPFTEIRRDHAQMTDGEIRGHLARFLFRGDDVDTPVSSLSGGERARLVLARLVLTEPSWLALDEPTNHLDLAARTALEEMLGEYQGALVCVSHDREFLDGMCNTIVAVEDGTVHRFDGNYSAWHAHRNAAAAEASEAAAARAAAEKKRRQEEARRAEEAAAKQRARGSRGGGRKKRPRNPYLFKKLEEAIIGLEEEKEGLESTLAREEVYKNADAMRDAQVRLAEIERDLEDKNRQWEEWA